MGLEALNDKPNFTILLIEDMSQIRQQLISDLRKLNYKGTIVEAETLTRAKTIIQATKIDLVICDWNMPDGKGIDFLIAVKKNPKYENLPFLMCTTMDEIINILDAIKQGAKEYIVKPWNIDELETKIKYVLK